MRKFLASVFSVFCVLSVQAATEITAYVQITNTPAGLTTNITVNIGAADTRNWTNAAAGAPSTSIQITNSRPASVTNLIQHFSAFPVYSAGVGTPQAVFLFSTTNTTNFTVTAPLNTNLTVTFGGNWATVFYITNTYSDASPLLAPTNAMSARLRTNAENAIVNLLSQNKSSNAVPFGTRSLSNYIDVGTAQTATNKAFITSTNRGGVIIAGRSIEASNVTLTTGVLTSVIITGGTNSGYVLALTNGVLYSNGLYFTRLSNPLLTNGINYGNAFRSEGSGGASLQLGSNALASGLRSVGVGVNAVSTNTDSAAFGTGAQALGGNSTAIGNAAQATNGNSTAVGQSSQATGSGATAIGNGAIASGSGSIAFGQAPDATAPSAIAIGDDDTLASGTNSIAIGGGTTATGFRAFALGDLASAAYDYSGAIGSKDHLGSIPGPNTTNQIAIGTVNQSVSIRGALEAGTIRSLHATGTNLIDGIFAFTNSLTVASVAPGHNVIDSKTNTILYLTGAPGAAWTLGGFTGDKTDGRELEVWNQTGFDVTIQNESGTAPTASDRILTYATVGGTNATLTGNGLMKFRYSGTAARWLLNTPAVDVLAQGTNGINSISTNGVSVSSAATALNIIGNENVSVERATNAAGAVSIQFAPVLFRCTNFGTLYNGGEWEQIVNEEWIGDMDSTTAANMGTHGWSALAPTGTLPPLAGPIVESNAWAYISVVTTQTTSCRIFAASYTSAGFATGWVATNCEYFMQARLRMNSTNKTTDVCRNIFGLYSSGIIGEPTAGVYVMNNTNVNTNTWIACTARAAGITRNFSTIATYDNMTWTDVGIYLDRTGTNAIFMYGPDRFRYTSFATNVSNLPGDSAGIGPAWQVERIASVDGTNFRTNYCDFVKIWVRRFL